MKKIKEIFYSLQGEGFHTGTPAVFIRFSGCNLRCPFCDTDFEGGSMMTDEEIIEVVAKYPAKMVILTGGEPSLFVDSTFLQLLHKHGYYICIETNGTHSLPEEDIDWITLSPKFDFCKDAKVVISKCDEVKVVYQNQDLSPYAKINAKHHFLQPCDSGSASKPNWNTQETIEACLAHPEWRLSLQTHKLINIQ